MPDTAQLTLEAASNLPRLLTSAVRGATFEWPLSMATPRAKWEALLSLLMGQNPVMGRSHPGDLPYLKVADDARELTRCWKQISFRVTVQRSRMVLHGPLTTGPDTLRRRPEVVPADEFLVLFGLLAFEEARELPRTEVGRFYELLLFDLVDLLSSKVSPKLRVPLKRLLGLPESSHGRPREKFNSLDRPVMNADPRVCPVGEDSCKHRPPTERPPLSVPERNTNAHLLERTFRWLAGKPSEEEDVPASPAWWELHVKADRIQAYLTRFRAKSLRRGGSAMVADVIACVREGLIQSSSVACLVRDLGGSLVFLLPSATLGLNPDEDADKQRKAAAQWVEEKIRSLMIASLRSPDGYFVAQYPHGAELANQKSTDERGLALDAWGSRGLFPDLLFRLRSVDFPVYFTTLTTGSRNTDAVERLIRFDSDLFASPPRALEPRCFGCHVEQGMLFLPWWPQRESLCPGCAIVATAGRRLAEHALDGATEDVPDFSRFVLAPSQREAFGDYGVTVYLDGTGVGSLMADKYPLQRMTLSRDIEGEVRLRYRDGIAKVGEKVGELLEAGRLRVPKKENKKKKDEDEDPLYFPVEVIFIGGDDICLCLHPDVAQSFLAGFFSQSRGDLKWAGVILAHSTGQHELVRLQDARRRLMSVAKQPMRDDKNMTCSLALTRMRPLAECAEEGSDGKWFDPVQTADSVDEAIVAWPKWKAVPS